MKMYKAKNKKTGKYINFNGENLICNCIEVFVCLMRVANEMLIVNGKEPFDIDDYEFEEVSEVGI